METRPYTTQHPPQRGRFNTRIPERRKEPREKPRIFLLKWNHIHMKGSEAQKYQWEECWGTLYPNGRVMLDSGSPYTNMSELRDYISQVGVYLFQWLEQGIQVLGEEEGTALNRQ